MQGMIEQTKRILIIDDNPSIHEDYRKILGTTEPTRLRSEAESEFFGDSDDDAARDESQPIDVQLDSAFQGQEALEKVKAALRERQPYSMAFVDMRMPPGWNGLKTIKELWREQPDLQVVICTAYSDNTWEEICRELGHSDQLLILKKPFDNVEVAQLAIALTKKWSLTRDARLRQSDLERMVEERTRALRHAALRDGLTGLANRTRLNALLEKALARVRRQDDDGAAFIIIDLDSFKVVNDSLGHSAGDQLIKGVAKRLAMNVRETDCVARLGGDEFAILQNPVGGDDASILVKRLFEVMEEPFEVEGSRVQVGMSCGIAVAPQDGTTPTELMKNADLALYRAKARGRNRFRFFEEDMDRRVKERRKIAGELKQAIEGQQFQLYYQPIMCMNSSEVARFEALIRWNHPERGVLTPGEFLNVAEYTGLTAPIGKWVIEQACQDALRFPQNVGVSVNVAARQFHRNHLLATVNNTLSETGLEPSRLQLEIVESVVLRNSDTVIRTLDQLSKLGVRFAMDDFGTGYSSLSYLRLFPFDGIKLDRSFVSDAPDNEEAMGIVMAVATLGKSLNLEITAEGVETWEQLQCVADAGYDFTQGYYHALPRPLDQVLEPYRASGPAKSAPLD